MKTTTKNPYDLPVWEQPADYGGFSPDGDYLIASRHRDSDVLEQSNYRSIMKSLEEIEKDLPIPPEIDREGGDRHWVYDFRASHWGFGWVEYLLIRQDSPDALQKAAYEILGALEDYPVLDDPDYYQAEYDAATEYWEWMGTDDRIRACQECGVSIFAARREEVPCDCSSYILEP